MAGHPHETTSDEKKHLPHLIAWEITRSCNLDCVHCRAAARYGPYEGEFSTEECMNLLDNIASFAQPIMILTGGEPLMRPDLFDIAKYGTDLGLRMVVSTNGTYLTPEVAGRLKEAGVRRVSISLDGATARSHDRFRRVEGAFSGSLDGIAGLKEAGLDFQINTTITKDNLEEIGEILALAEDLGAVAHHVFLLVPTGRAKEMRESALSADEYEKTLRWFYEKSRKSELHLKATCAPHYYRIMREMARDEGVRVDVKTFGFEAMTKGCMGGQSFAFVSHLGIVQICGYLEVECGDVRGEGYDFQKIWETSPVFQEMRRIDEYHGRCGVCEFRKVCGGCRARAYAISGDYLAEEPLCSYIPRPYRHDGADPKS